MRSSPSGLVASTAVTPAATRQSHLTRGRSSSTKTLVRPSIAEEERQPALRTWTPALWEEVSTSLRHAKAVDVIPWGRLELTEALAKGAFGQVSKGTYHFAEVAVKELLPGVGESKDLLDEMNTMCQLRHDNLLSMVGLATDYSTKLGVVMEFLPTTLHNLLHSSQYQARYAHVLTWAGCHLALVVDVGRGMAHLHTLGFVHRTTRRGSNPQQQPCPTSSSAHRQRCSRVLMPVALQAI